MLQNDFAQMTDQIIGILTNLDDFVSDKDTAKVSIIEFIKNSETNIFAVIQSIDYAGEYKNSLNQLFNFISENMDDTELNFIAKMYLTFLNTYESPTIEIKLNFIIYTCTTWFKHINFMTILLSNKLSNKRPLSFLQFVIACIGNPIINPAYYKDLDLLVQLVEFFLINYQNIFTTVYENNITNTSFDETKYDNLNALSLNEAKMSYYFTNIRILEKLWTTYSDSLSLNDCLDNKYDYFSTKTCRINQYDVLEESKIERNTSILEFLFYNYSTLI